MFTVDYDHELGLIRCTCKGFLTLENVRDYGVRVKDAIARSRAKFGNVKMLVISLDSVVQSAEVMKAVQQERWPKIHPGDRMAVVVTSVLVKMQASRLFEPERDRAFLSEAEAMAWLMEDRPVRGAMPAAAAR